MRNIFIPLTVVFLVAACGPRDIAQKVGRGGDAVNVNEYYLLKNKGDLSSTCKSGKPFSTMNPPADQDVQIFSGKVTAFMEVGNQNCFRIGDIVELRDHKTPGAVSRGKVKVTGAEILHVSKLTQSHADAFSTSVDVLKQRAQVAMASVTFPHREMVSLTFFEYVDEDSVPLTEIIEVTEVGTMSPACPADFTPAKSIDIPVDKDEQIKSGTLIGFMAAGDRNCFQIGSTVSLKAKTKKGDPVAPERAKLKIAWVEIVPVDKLNKDHAQILNITLLELKVSAEQMIQGATFDAKNSVNITVFEYIPEVAP